MLNRVEITAANLKEARDALEFHEIKRLVEKGCYSFASMHECRGVIDEEVEELKEAFHSRSQPAIRHELLDVAFACLFILACIDASGLDW